MNSTSATGISEGNSVKKATSVSIDLIPNWYAFVTRPRHEKKVKEKLDAAGITSYLPLRKSLHQWKDRKRWVETPLFSCYIFSYIPYANRFNVLYVPGVVRIVSFSGRPCPVRAEEIENIKKILGNSSEIHVVDGILPGDKVRIVSGILADLEGYVVEFRNRKWFVVYVTALGKSVLVDARESGLEKS